MQLLARSDDASRQVSEGQRLDQDQSNELCLLVSASPSQDEFDPRGGNGCNRNQENAVPPPYVDSMAASAALQNQELMAQSDDFCLQRTPSPEGATERENY